MSEKSDEDDLDDDFIEKLETDLSEKAKVTAFVTNITPKNDCVADYCKFGEGEKPCSASLALNDFVDSRNNCPELTSTELNLVILGAIQSSLNCDKVSTSGRSHKHRKQTRMNYYHGKRICYKIFLFLHCINKNGFYRLVMHYRKNRLTVRVNGNKKRLPSSAFSSETVERVVKFILNAAEEQALLLAGRYSRI